MEAKSSIEQLMKLYQSLIQQPLTGSETYSHITIDINLLSSSGEIPKEWLDDYKVKTWTTLEFNCGHCKRKIKSLSALIRHIKEVCYTKTKIQCAERGCDRGYLVLNSYVNHVVKSHYESLAYSCIECGKFFYNTGCLIQHYSQVHPLVRNIYPCIECGYYALNHQNLVLHLMTHKTQEVSDDEQESAATKNPATTDHQKARKRMAEGVLQDSSKRSKMSPCN